MTNKGLKNNHHKTKQNKKTVMDHPGDNKDLRIKRHFYKINLWTTCKLHVFYVKYLFQDSTKYKKT